MVGTLETDILRVYLYEELCVKILILKCMLLEYIHSRPSILE